MPNKLRFCVLCNQYDRTNRSSYTRIYTAEREAKLLEGYRRRHNGQELTQPILNQLVHKKCYNKIVQGVSPTDEPISSNDILTSVEQQQQQQQEEDDNDEEQDQTSLIQFRSRMPFPSNINKNLFERRQRVCAICNRYGYRSYNKMKQIVSNFMANKLAEGFSYLYKRPFGRSLLDAYIHELCFRKLYSTYRYHTSRKFHNNNRSQHQGQFLRHSFYSPHGTRSRSICNKPSEEVTSKITIEQLFSTPFYTSAATTNPNVELSARSCLFRPCIKRLTPEEIEFHTQRKSISETIINATTASTTNDSMIYSNQDDNDNTVSINEQDKSPDWTPKRSSTTPLMFNKQHKFVTAAKIRRRYLKPPPLAKPTNPLISDHTYINNTFSKKPPIAVEDLYHWLLEELKTSGYPISMGNVLTKYRELSDDEKNKTTRESICRDRVRQRLEKFYSNQFVFITPNKREGTFVALNDVNHYVRLAIKTAKQKKEQADETSILSSIIIPPAPVDHKRQTCETVMNAIRKIRLYIRDPAQINSLPSLLVRNLIGLITTSERQFEKSSHQYDFYRMIDEDLFDNSNNKLSNKLDKNLRNISLASDLISARHDNRTSQKHFLLAEEFTKEGFHCTPKQVITVLNRYGHTCSYKSYTKMKALRQRTTSEFGEIIIDEIEGKSSDSEMDMIEL